MNDADLMKCMDLATRLSLILGVNPVWKGGYVIYSVGLDDQYIKLCFDLDNGRWLIAGGDYGVLNLPKEMPELMAEMSELVKGKRTSHDNMGK